MFNGVSTTDEIYIVPDNCAALIGRSWIRGLNINLADLDESGSGYNTTDVFNNQNGIEKIMAEFANVFEEKIGCVPTYVVSLKLRESASPVYTKERQIPYALTERVEKELNYLESAGISSKISNSFKISVS